MREREVSLDAGPSERPGLDTDVGDVRDGRVRQLPPHVANQIAAGEVVERPASVVKELVENALDAKARVVEVEVEGGGLSLIRVSDDGVGMGPKDAELSLLRHATSKLKDVSDLERVGTLGFRGEAIPSIASVSRFSFTTTARGALEGTKIVVDGGQFIEAASTGAAAGTRVEVKDLFFNQPARRKFMKQPSTEVSHIVEVLSRLALAHPDVAFKLSSNGRAILDVPRISRNDPLGRLGRILGHEVAERMVPILALEPKSDIGVKGFLASPELSERTPRSLHAFVNGRFVRDRTIQHAIQDAFRTMLERGRYPIVVLLLEMDPASFDVNVHPQKIEVRFARSQDVHRAISRALARTLAKDPWLGAGREDAQHLGRTSTPLFIDPGTSDSIRDDPPFGDSMSSAPPLVDRGTKNSTSKDPALVDRWTRGSTSNGPISSDPPLAEGQTRGFGADFFSARPGVARSKALSSERPTPRYDDASADRWAVVREGEGAHLPLFSRLEPIGQVLTTYLVCEGDGRVVLIDQHAAHERVVFERLRTQHAARKLKVQPLLIPLPIELDPVRLESASAHQSDLASLGFELEPFGGSTWVLKSCPTTIRCEDLGALVRDLLDELRTVERSTPLEEVASTLMARAACHSVVRAGERLTKEEIRALLVAMDQVDFGARCPHGRPVFVEWTARELAKLFHRV